MRYPYKLVIFSMLCHITLCQPAYAGEIRIKVPQEKLASFVRVMSLINGIFSPTNPQGMDKSVLASLADKILPIASRWKVRNLAEMSAEVFVMKDEVIIQMPDSILRHNMDEAFRWRHVTDIPEKDAIRSVSNYCLEIASFGRYSDISHIPAEISVRFDDPKWEVKQ